MNSRTARTRRGAVVTRIALAAAVAVVGGLAGLGISATASASGSATGHVRPAITNEEITRASLSVLTFALGNVAAVTEPCPLTDATAFNAHLGQHGFSMDPATFEVDVYYQDVADSGYPGLDCGSPLPEDGVPPPGPHLAILGAAYLGEDLGFDQFLTQFDGASVTQTVADPEIGGEIGGVCRGGSTCWLNWHRDTLVITLILVGGNGVGQASAEAALLSLVPDAVNRLIAYSDSLGTATTVAPVATTAPLPPTTAAPTMLPTPTLPAPTLPAPTLPATTIAVAGIPAATQQPTGLGADPVLDALARSCFDGDMAACDDLFGQSPAGSAYETYADTCAGRQPTDTGRYCVDAFAAGSAPTTATATTAPVSTVPTLPTQPLAAGPDVTAAKAGLARYFATAPLGTTGSRCPLGDTAVLAATMTANGLAPAVDQFRVSTIGLDPIAPDTPQAFCAMDAPLETVPRGSVYATDITAVTTFPELIAANAGHAIVSPDPTLGGELGGSCYDYEGRASCWVMWHQDGLVLDVYLTAAPGTLTETTAVAIAAAMVPALLASLAAFEGA